MEVGTVASEDGYIPAVCLSPKWHPAVCLPLHETEKGVYTTLYKRRMSQTEMVFIIVTQIIRKAHHLKETFCVEGIILKGEHCLTDVFTLQE